MKTLYVSKGLSIKMKVVEETFTDGSKGYSVYVDTVELICKSRAGAEELFDKIMEECL